MLKIGDVYVNTHDVHVTMIVVITAMHTSNISFLTIYDNFNSNWSGKISTVPTEVFEAYFNANYFSTL